MTIRFCKKERCKDSAGNCPTLGSDGLPVQCVGPWVEDKYFFLERYLIASREVRKKFADYGNSVYLDFFSGPGRCIIENENLEIDGGGLRALKTVPVPFDEYHYFDIQKANVEALGKRLHSAKCHLKCGDSNRLVNMLIPKLLQKPYRYHFAFVDPYGPDGLKFNTLRELAKLDKMDMLIHFPIGTDIWRQKITGLHSDKIFRTLVDVFTDQLKSIGYPDEGLKLASSEEGFYAGLSTVPIRNTRNVKLYTLILASKHPRAQKIWNSVIKISPKGQKGLF